MKPHYATWLHFVYKHTNKVHAHKLSPILPHKQSPHLATWLHFVYKHTNKALAARTTKLPDDSTYNIQMFSVCACAACVNMWHTHLANKHIQHSFHQQLVCELQEYGKQQKVLRAQTK